jgi:serine/threonine protein kinase
MPIEATPMRPIPSPADFTIIGKIGKGSFGSVYLATYEGRTVALKVIKKLQLFQRNLTAYALAERNILAATSHPFVIQLHSAFQNTRSLFMALDYCE